MFKMKLTDYVVEFLQKKGIRDFFGYQGTMIAHLVDSIEKNPHTKSHSSYHEQGAAFAACGYAQAKGACGCAYATSGPGAANLLSGVADAYFDSLPVIFITGQLNTYEYSGIAGLRQQGFQEIDMVSMAKPVTKYAIQVRDPKDIVRELNLAWQIANTGRKGPVLIQNILCCLCRIRRICFCNSIPVKSGSILRIIFSIYGCIDLFFRKFHIINRIFHFTSLYIHRQQSIFWIRLKVRNVRYL